MIFETTVNISKAQLSDVSLAERRAINGSRSKFRATLLIDTMSLDFAEIIRPLLAGIHAMRQAAASAGVVELGADLKSCIKKGDGAGLPQLFKKIVIATSCSNIPEINGANIESFAQGAHVQASVRFHILTGPALGIHADLLGLTYEGAGVIKCHRRPVGA